VDHDETRAQLRALATGRLDQVTRARIEAHLAECESCRRAATTARTIAVALRDAGAELFEEHPDTERLRRHAAGSVDTAIVRHVQSCASCALEVRAWSARAAPTPDARRTWMRPTSIAAAALAAGLLLGLLVPPLFRDTGGATPQSAAPIARVLLQHPLRGAAEEPALTIIDPSASVLLDAAFDLPESVDPSSTITFTVLDEGGRAVWSRSDTAAPVAAALSRHELVGFLVPARVLAAGRYRLEVTHAGATPGTLLVARFRVVRDADR
jgi:hypothetical protein